MTRARDIEGSPSRPRIPGERAFFVCAFLVLGFVALELPYAVWPLQVHSDEHYYVVAADRMMASGDYVLPETVAGETRLKKPPLAYYQIVAGVTLFGQSVWATKVFWLVSAALVLGVTFRLARIAGASLVGAAVAVSALGGHRAFFRSATQHIPDMPLVLGTVVALAGFVALLAGLGGRRRWLLYLLSYGGIAWAIMAKGVLAPALLVAWFAARILGRHERFPTGEWRTELSAAALALLATGWWFGLAWMRAPDAFVADFFGDQVTEKVRLTAISVLGNLRKLSTDILGPGIAFALALFLFRPRALWRCTRWREGPILLLILWTAMVFGIFAFASVLYERYVLPALPAVAVLVGLAADSLPIAGLTTRLRRAVGIALPLAAVAGVIVALVLLVTGWPLVGAASIGAALAGLALVWRSLPFLPTWALAGLLGGAYPLLMAAMLPLHLTYGLPTRDMQAAAILNAAGIAPERTWLIGSRKLAGQIGVMTGGVAGWHWPATLDDLPETGPAAVIADDPDLVAPLEARGFDVKLYRAFSIDKLTPALAFEGLRAGDLDAAGRRQGKVAVIGLRGASP